MFKSFRLLMVLNMYTIYKECHTYNSPSINNNINYVFLQRERLSEKQQQQPASKIKKKK